MVSAGFSAFGTKLTVTAGVTEVKETTRISVNLGKIDRIDITNHNSPDRTEENVPGIIRGGTIGVEGNFVPTDPGQVALITAFQAGTDDMPLVVTLPDTGDATFTGTGHVESFELPGLNFDGKAGFTAVIATKGKLTFAA